MAPLLAANDMVDPFDTLGLEPRYALDAKLLAERHRALSGALHPDRYVGRPAAERRMALDKAIDVNAAMRALRDPVRRAEALLARHGVEVSETNQPAASPALLMEMMEVRESLAEAKATRDLDAINQLADRMRTRETDVVKALSRGFDERGDGVSIDASALLLNLGTLRYLRRFFEELEVIEDELLC